MRISHADSLTTERAPYGTRWDSAIRQWAEKQWLWRTRTDRVADDMILRDDSLRKVSGKPSLGQVKSTSLLRELIPRCFPVFARHGLYPDSAQIRRRPTIAMVSPMGQKCNVGSLARGRFSLTWVKSTINFMRYTLNSLSVLVHNRPTQVKGPRPSKIL